MTNRLTTPPTHHGNAEKITPRNFDLLWFHRIHPTDPFQFLVFFWKVAGGRKLEEFQRNMLEYVFFNDFDISVVQYHKKKRIIRFPPKFSYVNPSPNRQHMSTCLLLGHALHY